MKKLISLILLFTFIIVLGGCQNKIEEECDDGYRWDVVFQECRVKDYYSVAEVDLMLEELYDLHIEENAQDISELNEWCVDVWLDVPDAIMSSNEYYANYDCIDMLEWYGENWEEIYEMLNFDYDLLEAFFEENFYTKDEMNEWWDYERGLLDDVIDDLTGNTLDYDILLTTIATLDILIMTYEADYENLTEEDIMMYELMLIMREDLYTELGGN